MRKNGGNGVWESYQGAVSLSFDDGRTTQLDIAMPMLDEFELKGTFYLCPNGGNWQHRYVPWKRAADAGHEIGNHTLSHVCSNNVTGGRGGLEDKSLEEVELDIIAAQEHLFQLAPDQRHWTFAYPCYCTHVGRGRDRQSYVPVIAKHFLAGRTGGQYGFGNHPVSVDLACAWGSPVERMSGFEMIGLVEELTAQGQWVILTFHEIDGNDLSVSGSDFRMLLRYLRRNEERIWTAPVVDVAEKVSAYQQSR